MYRREPREESVYELIPQPAPIDPRPPMYRSKYPSNVPPTASTFGASTASQIPVTNLAGSYDLEPRVHRHKTSGSTFGTKNLHYSDPTSFQRRNSMPELLEPARFQYSITVKPPIDAYNPRAGVRTAPVRNFIKNNALAVIMSEARKPVDNNVNYLKKSDFAKVPSYLSDVKKEIAAEKDYIRQIMAREHEEEMRYQPKMRLLTEDERQHLLTDLKKKWDVVNKQYQTMTHLVSLDTHGKVRRKEQYESELQSLEKAIEKLSKKYVFVHDD